MSVFVILFLILLPVVFAVLFFALRPTKEEQSVQQRLTMIEKSLAGAGDEDTTDILKQEVLSEVPWLNEILQMVPFSNRLRRLPVQGDSHRAVAKTIFWFLFVGGLSPW